MLQTTDKSTSNKSQNPQTENQNAPDIAGETSDSRITRNIEYLSTVVNLAKCKKSKSIKSKKLALPKAYFAKANSSKTDLLTSITKKVFIYLQKTFIGAPILRYFHSEYYIYIETDASGYAISRVLNQITLD